VRADQQPVIWMNILWGTLQHRKGLFKHNIWLTKKTVCIERGEERRGERERERERERDGDEDGDEDGEGKGKGNRARERRKNQES